MGMTRRFEREGKRLEKPDKFDAKLPFRHFSPIPNLGNLAIRYTVFSVPDSVLLTEPEILALVRQSQEGDGDAFRRLYDHFFPQVYRYTAFRFDREMAEDIVADIFLKVWEKISSYEERAGIPFGAWLFRIARYTVIDAFRSRKETLEVSEEISDADPMNRADDRVQRNELLKTVRGALDQLPKKYRDVLTLSYFADLSITEIAKTLKRNEGSVRVLKFRALEKLSTLLPPELRGQL